MRTQINPNETQMTTEDNDLFFNTVYTLLADEDAWSTFDNDGKILRHDSSGLKLWVGGGPSHVDTFPASNAFDDVQQCHIWITYRAHQRSQQARLAIAMTKEAEAKNS